MAECDIAWLAGFFDGEGCVRGRSHWKKTNTGHRHVVDVSLVLTQRDRQVLEHCLEILGVGSIPAVKKNPITHYYFVVGGHNQVLQVINMLLPYSVVKKDQLLVAKELIEGCNHRRGRGYTVPPEELERRFTLLEKLSSLKGHWRASYHRSPEKAPLTDSL